MRHFATAVLILSLFQSPADAKSAPPDVAAPGVNLPAVTAVPRKYDLPRVTEQIAEKTELDVKDPPEEEPDRTESPESTDNFGFVCRKLQSAARVNNLPVAFLTRLIWQESRFDAHAVSPSGARGVAQFMPRTAAWLGLANPFDVSDAINKSAEFLRDLRNQFSNLGLAAAAYNAGPQRVRDWLAGGRGLPPETEAYVSIVTGHKADDWRVAQPNQWNLMLPDAVPCPQLVKLLADKPERIGREDKLASAPVGTSSEAVWGLQLIGDPSQASALAEYYQLQKTYKSVLGGRAPLVLRSKVGRSGYWYRVRVAANSLFRAEKLCSDLRAIGGRCLVQRN